MSFLIQVNLPTLGYDHSPIMMNTYYKDNKGERKFKVETTWLTLEDCKKMVKKG